MKFGVIVFPGSNCDRDMQFALQEELGYEVLMFWHKDYGPEYVFHSTIVLYYPEVFPMAIICDAAPLPGLAR